ncbi:hypothetical protein ACJJVG_08870 [Pseudocitrobacter faecalis]|uniref:hypothetical protein n=1 Tax=Pseudocitrobacter faecalis TaxID=1398493 RepID=UPI00389AC703
MKIATNSKEFPSVMLWLCGVCALVSVAGFGFGFALDMSEGNYYSGLLNALLAGAGALSAYVTYHVTGFIWSIAYHLEQRG